MQHTNNVKNPLFEAFCVRFDGAVFEGVFAGTIVALEEGGWQVQEQALFHVPNGTRYDLDTFRAWSSLVEEVHYDLTTNTARVYVKID